MNIITSEMSRYVTGAMTTLIQQKGDMTKMIYAEDVEAFLLSKNVKVFVPVALTISALIDARYVRFFTLDNGRRVFGYTKRAIDKLQPFVDKANKEKFQTVGAEMEIDADEVRRIKFEQMKERYLKAKEADDVEMMTQYAEELAGYAPYVKDAEMPA